MGTGRPPGTAGGPVRAVGLSLGRSAPAQRRADWVLTPSPFRYCQEAECTRKFALFALGKHLPFSRTQKVFTVSPRFLRSPGQRLFREMRPFLGYPARYGLRRAKPGSSVGRGFFLCFIYFSISPDKLDLLSQTVHILTLLKREM